MRDWQARVAPRAPPQTAGARIAVSQQAKRGGLASAGGGVQICWDAGDPAILRHQQAGCGVPAA